MTSNETPPNRPVARPTESLDRDDDGSLAVPVPETAVEPGEEVYRCPYCGRPFRTIRLKTLHVGEMHEPEATDEERQVFEKARELESDDLFFFHIKIVIALGALYSMSVIGYTVVIGLGG